MASNKRKNTKGLFAVLVLGLIFAALACCVVIMMFTDTAIFGYSYKSFSANSTLTTIDNKFIYAEQVDIIDIDVENQDVIINKTGKSDDNTFEIDYQIKFSGFYKVSETENKTPFSLQASLDVNEDNETVLHLSVFNPSGIRFVNSGTIVINIPTNTISGFDVKINTTKGDVIVGTEALQTTNSTFAIYAADITTKQGDITVGEYCDIGNYFLSSSESFATDSGKIIFSPKSNKIGELAIAVNSGNADFSATNINADSVKINSTYGDVTFGVVNGSITQSGKAGRIFAQEINGNVYAQEDSTHTDFDIDVINGQFILSNGDYNQIHIGSINNKVSIKNNKGTITIDEVLPINILGSLTSVNSVVVETGSGNVNVAKCNAIVKIKATSAKINLEMLGNYANVATTSGNIDINYKGLALEDGISSCNATSEKGNITIGISSSVKTLLKMMAKTIVYNYGAEYTSTDYRESFKEQYVNCDTATSAIELSTQATISIKQI